MKLKIAGLDNELDLENNEINILEIEDKNLFKKLILDFNNSINYKYETREIIMNDSIEGSNKEIDISKNCNIYLDVFNLEVNSKQIITKLYDKIEKNIILEQSIDRKFQEYLYKIKNYIENIVLDLNFDCNINDIVIKDLLKILGIKINIDYTKTLEDKIFFLFDILSEFESNKILIFINLKQYFEDDILIEIYKYAIKNEMKLILIEQGNNKNLIKYEKKIFIDKEFDDFYIN